MRHYRQNADPRFRELERRAAGGDPEARAMVFIERLRQGVRVEEVALEVLHSLSVRELQGLADKSAMDSLAGDLAIARHTRLNPKTGAFHSQEGRPSGGWFPDHTAQDVCPRGHGIARAGGFDFNMVGLSWDRAREATEDFLVRDGDTEGGDEDANWTSCRTCDASWPSTEWGYEL